MSHDLFNLTGEDYNGSSSDSGVSIHGKGAKSPQMRSGGVFVRQRTPLVHPKKRKRPKASTRAPTPPAKRRAVIDLTGHSDSPVDSSVGQKRQRSSPPSLPRGKRPARPHKKRRDAERPRERSRRAGVPFSFARSAAVKAVAREHDRSTTSSRVASSSSSDNEEDGPAGGYVLGLDAESMQRLFGEEPEEEEEEEEVKDVVLGITGQSTEEGECSPGEVEAGLLKDAEAKRAYESSCKKPSRYFAPDANITIKCYNCRGVGHIAAQCTNERKERPCYLCLEMGHTSARCPNDFCYRCLKQGHQARDCNAKTAVSTEVCWRCGQQGHNVMECFARVEMRGLTCMVCGQKGHVNCMKPPSTVPRQPWCSSCCKEGHCFYQCRASTSRGCFRCGALGHQARDCPTEARFQEEAPRGRCYECRKFGHQARDCPSRASSVNERYLPTTCFNCGAIGHLARDCTVRRSHSKGRHQQGNYGRRHTPPPHWRR